MDAFSTRNKDLWKSLEQLESSNLTEYFNADKFADSLSRVVHFWEAFSNNEHVIISIALYLLHVQRFPFSVKRAVHYSI